MREESLCDLRIAYHKVTRKKQGSKRRRHTIKQLAKNRTKKSPIKGRITGKKLTRELATSYSLIAIEVLNLQFMNKNKYLSRSSYDTGPGIFMQLMTYKTEETCGQLVPVNPEYTSQICSECGEIVEKDLSVRTHKYPFCGFVLDRDVKAV